MEIGERVMRGISASLASFVFLVAAGTGTAGARGDAASDAAGFVAEVGNQVIAILQQDIDKATRERHLTTLFQHAFNT